MLGRIARAHAAHISDIVGQRRHDRMAPIVGRDHPLEATSAQDVLHAEGHERRVLAIVVERIAAADALND